MFLEIPLTLAAAGTVAAPLQAGRGTIAALIVTLTDAVESDRAELTDGGLHDQETGGRQ